MPTKEETNICKGIAIIMMLFHHLFNDFEEYAGFVVDYSPFTAERLTFLAILSKICVAILSKICVAIFVFLSGYGMAYTYRRKFDSRKPEKKEICSYIRNRYWKVMSGYWFVFLFALLCQPLGRTVVEAYGTSIKEILLYFLVDFLGLSYLLSTPTLNPTWWYMSIAVFIIFLMPFIMRLMQKYGAITVLVVLTAGINLTGTANASTFYLFSLLLRATCLETGFFERLMQSGNKNYMNKTVLIFCEIVCFFLLLQYRTNYNINGIIDGLIALVITSFVHTFIGKISGVSQIMQFLGKHSMNIFLTHTLLYSYYFLGFFYSFRHWFLILMVLLLVSILVSVVIEKMKEKTGYVQKMERVSGKTSGRSSQKNSEPV